MELIHKHNVDSEKLASIDTKFRSRHSPSEKKSGEDAFGEDGAGLGSSSRGLLGILAIFSLLSWTLLSGTHFRSPPRAGLSGLAHLCYTWVLRVQSEEIVMTDPFPSLNHNVQACVRKSAIVILSL